MFRPTRKKIKLYYSCADKKNDLYLYRGEDACTVQFHGTAEVAVNTGPGYSVQPVHPSSQLLYM